MLQLSRAEQRVYKLALLGRSIPAIAAQSNIKPSTVKFHLTRIYKKLGVQSRAEMLAVVRSFEVEAALQNGLSYDPTKLDLNLQFDKSKDILLFTKKNSKILFKNARRAALFFNCSGETLANGINRLRFRGYRITILKGG